MGTKSVVSWVGRAAMGVAVAGALVGFASPAVAAPRLAADAVDAADTTDAVTLSGTASGPVTDVAVECNDLGDNAYAWQLTGQLGESALNLTFNTNNYRGAATYNATGVTDEQGGLMTLEVGQVQVTTDGDTPGTFTVGDDERSGSVNADLRNYGTGEQVHVEGTWHCS